MSLWDIPLSPDQRTSSIHVLSRRSRAQLSPPIPVLPVVGLKGYGPSRLRVLEYAGWAAHGSRLGNVGTGECEDLDWCSGVRCEAHGSDRIEAGRVRNWGSEGAGTVWKVYVRWVFVGVVERRSRRRVEGIARSGVYRDYSGSELVFVGCERLRTEGARCRMRESGTGVYRVQDESVECGREARTRDRGGERMRR